MAGQQQSQQGGENSLAALWITIGLFLLGWGIWHYFQIQIAGFVYALRSWEITAVSFFTPALDQTKQWMAANPPYVGMSIEILVNISDQVGRILRYPVIAILAVLATVLFFHDAKSRYKKLYSMKRLLKEESVNWKQSIPIMDADLVNTPLDKAPWAISLSPMRFAKRFKLLGERKELPVSASSGTKAKFVYEVDRGRSERVFSMQLGRFWTGLDDLKPYELAIFAILAARADHNSKASTTLMHQISASAADKNFDFSGTRDLLVKHMNNKGVVRVVHSHAYILTVFASLLELARLDGVLATADLLWVKAVDRRLWFVLNTMGRQTPCCEIAGVFAHFLVEKEIGRRIIVPMIDEAVKAFEIAMADIIAPPEELEEG